MGAADFAAEREDECVDRIRKGPCLRLFGTIREIDERPAMHLARQLQMERGRQIRLAQ